MDAQFIQQYYKITNVVVLRNLPRNYSPDKKINLKEKLSIPEDCGLLLYQGVLLEGRGLARTIEAIKNLSKVHFVILGEGVERKNLECLSEDLGVSSRVHFMGTINQSELANYTAEADIGLSLIENISLSYYYALPNKLFEYIASGVPVICSDMPQMKMIIDKYKVGECINLDADQNLEKKISDLLENKSMLKEYSENAEEAAKELNWEVEFEKVKSYFPA
jgi:glycosyltransferase involved in cell wall biosynthesis